MLIQNFHSDSNSHKFASNLSNRCQHCSSYTNNNKNNPKLNTSPLLFSLGLSTPIFFSSLSFSSFQSSRYQPIQSCSLLSPISSLSFHSNPFHPLILSPLISFRLPLVAFLLSRLLSCSLHSSPLLFSPLLLSPVLSYRLTKGFGEIPWTGASPVTDDVTVKAVCWTEWHD